MPSIAKPFKCSCCGMRFACQSKLKRHSRTHTGERPFKCQVCGRGFSQKGNRNIHLRRHFSTEKASPVPNEALFARQRWIAQLNLLARQRWIAKVANFNNKCRYAWI